MIVILFSLFVGFLLTGGMNIPLIDRLKVSGAFFAIFLAIVVIFADKRDETVINTVKEEVISINPNDAFTIGIKEHYNLLYTFFVKNENGNMKLKEVKASNVDVIKGKETPYYEESECLPPNKFSWVLWVYMEDKEDCGGQYIKRTLYVPENTIFK